jgi:hypothetical protein
MTKELLQQMADALSDNEMHGKPIKPIVVARGMAKIERLRGLLSEIVKMGHSIDPLDTPGNEDWAPKYRNLAERVHAEIGNVPPAVEPSVVLIAHASCSEHASGPATVGADPDAERSFEECRRKIGDWWDHTEEQREAFKWGFLQGFESGTAEKSGDAPPDLWTCDECAGPPRPYEEVQCVLGKCKPVRT